MLGLILGLIKVRGVSFGVVAVLFVALALSWLGLTIENSVLGFMRDFAMILFIYPIGLQVGPSFFSSLRGRGVTVESIWVVGRCFERDFYRDYRARRAPAARADAMASTPGASRRRPRSLRAKRRFATSCPPVKPRAAALQLASSVYAAAYPFGLLGPIILVLLFRVIFRVNVDSELAALRRAELAKRPPIETMDIEITRAELDGIAREGPHDAAGASPGPVACSGTTSSPCPTPTRRSTSATSIVSWGRDNRWTSSSSTQDENARWT